MYANRYCILKTLIFFPVLLPIFIIFALQYIFHQQILLYHWNIISAFFFYLFTTISLASIIQCTLTNPGEVLGSWSDANLPYAYFDNESDKRKFKEVHPLVVLDKGKYPKYQYCSTCDLVVPPKTTHCGICNRCTLSLDHHCPWVGNCIGFYNLKFFILFSGYGALSGLIIGVNLLPKALDIMFQGENSEIVNSI